MSKQQKPTVQYRHRVKYIGDYSRCDAARTEADVWLRENGIHCMITGVHAEHPFGSNDTIYRFRKKVDMMYFLLVKGGKDWALA